MSDPTAEERIAAVKQQAKGVAEKEGIAQASNEGALRTGLGLSTLHTIATGNPVALVSFGAGLAGFQFGSWVAEQTHAAEYLADGLEALGMHRLGKSGPEGPHPATIDHPIAHSSSWLGFLGGVLLGVAAGLFVVATFGTGAAVLIGAAAVGGAVSGFAIPTLAGALSQFGSGAGKIITGSPDVYIGGRAAARMTDTAACAKDAPPPQPIIEGSETIFINRLPLARKGHKLLCGAVIDDGVPSVFVDKTTVACATPASEIPVWMRVAVDWIGVLLLARALSRSFQSPRPTQFEPVPPKTYPTRSPLSEQAMKNVLNAMERAGVGKSKGMAVGTHVDAKGNVTVAVSGPEGKAQGIYNRIAPYLPENYKFAPTNEVPLQTATHPETGLPFEGGKNCVETKLSPAMNGDVPTDGMSVEWWGKEGTNRYPTSPGSTSMKPCPSCELNEGTLGAPANPGDSSQ